MRACISNDAKVTSWIVDCCKEGYEEPSATFEFDAEGNANTGIDTGISCITAEEDVVYNLQGVQDRRHPPLAESCKFIRV